MSNPLLPRRILMTADTVGGVWTYVVELCRGLGKHGIEVALATMGAPPNDSQRNEAESLKNVELFTSTLRLEWMAEPWDDVAQAGEWLLELEERTRPDLIHLNNFAHGAYPWCAPVMVIGHSCVLSWWRAVKCCEAPPEWNTYRTVVANGLHAAQLVVAPSNAMMDSLIDCYGPFQASAVIPNGRELETSPSLPKEQLILAAGRLWDEAKNIRAVASVAKELLWPLYVAGDEIPPHEGDASGLSDSQFSQQNVIGLGRLPADELLGWYQRAAIYVLPARYEPFGLTALEAALSGCALVLGDIQSLREIWGDAALFVNPGDLEDLQKKLQRLIGNPIEVQSLATSARVVAQEYSTEKMLAGYLEAYSQLLANSQPDEQQKHPDAASYDSAMFEKGAFACAS